MEETPQNNRIRPEVQGQPGSPMGRLPKQLRDWRVLAGAAAVVIALAAGLHFATGPESSAAAKTAGGAGKVAEWPDDYTMGDPKAPVQVIEYHSLTCPHCAHFDETSLPQIKKTYIDTGKVRYISRAFPLNAIDVSAFMVARCIDRAHYFDAVSLIYRRQPQWLKPDQENDVIMNALADVMREAGMSRAQFEQCLKSTETLQRLRKDQLDGEENFRVNSTPTFVINGEVQTGDMTFANFQKAVDPVLAKAGKP